MTFLEGYALWLWYTLGALIYLILVLLIVCAPIAVLYAAILVLARLLVRLREGVHGTRGSPLRHHAVPVQVERARETRRTDGRGGKKDGEG